MSNPEWDAEGNPLNLLAAAEDAYEWLEWAPNHIFGVDWRKMISARDELRKFLDAAQQ